MRPGRSCPGLVRLIIEGVSKSLKFMLSAVLLVAAGVGAFALGGYLRPKPAPAGTALNNPVDVRGLDLVDQHGSTVDLAGDFGGDVTLVFFGFTRCPDVCPLTMARLEKAYVDAGEPDDLKVVMVSVDPEFDTPEVIGEYVGRFHSDFVGLTGSNSQVAAAARTFFAGYSGTGPAIAHTDAVAVVDRQGQLRYVYTGDAVVSLGADLPGLLESL